MRWLTTIALMVLYMIFSLTIIGSYPFRDNVYAIFNMIAVAFLIVALNIVWRR